MNEMKEMIKQAMRDEMTLEDILQAVKDAREEVEEEKAPCVDLGTARKDAVLAALDYIVTLGVLPASYKISEEDITQIENTLKSKEPELKAYANTVKMMMPMLMGREEKDVVKMGIWRP